MVGSLLGAGGTDPLQYEQNFIPVRGCLSVAVGVPMRGPNPREGIHPAMLEWPFEVPPHRVGRPWPRTVGGAAEWRWGKLRVSRVSVRSNQLRPRSCRDVRDGDICGDGGHGVFFYRFGI